MEEPVLTPEEDDRWGLIGEYSEELEYDYSENARDYVVAEGTVFRSEEHTSELQSRI